MKPQPAPQQRSCPRPRPQPEDHRIDGNRNQQNEQEGQQDGRQKRERLDKNVERRGEHHKNSNRWLLYFWFGVVVRRSLSCLFKGLFRWTALLQNRILEPLLQRFEAILGANHTGPNKPV